METHIIYNKVRGNAVFSVNFERVFMYWQLGDRIFIEDQNSHERAEYGKCLIKNLAIEINLHLGGASIQGNCAVPDSFTEHIQLCPHCGHN